LGATNSWQTAAEGLKKLDAVKYGKVVDLTETRKLEKALSAATAAKVLGGLRCVLGVLGGVVFVAGLVSAFLPAQPDPTIMKSLNTIQVVTNETLSRVKELQVSMSAVSQELTRLELKIEELSCSSASDVLKTYVKNIKSFWQPYYGDPDTPGAQPTRGSYAGQFVAQVGSSAPFPAIAVNPVLRALVDKWADDVINPATGMMNNIIGIYEGLDSQGGAGLIRRCGQYYADTVKSSGPLPFDDRQYYQQLMELVAVRERGGWGGVGKGWGGIDGGGISCSTALHSPTPQTPPPAPPSTTQPGRRVVCK